MNEATLVRWRSLLIDRWTRAQQSERVELLVELMDIDEKLSRSGFPGTAAKRHNHRRLSCRSKRIWAMLN